MKKMTQLNNQHIAKIRCLISQGGLGKNKIWFKLKSDG